MYGFEGEVVAKYGDKGCLPASWLGLVLTVGLQVYPLHRGVQCAAHLLGDSEEGMPAPC